MELQDYGNFNHKHQFRIRGTLVHNGKNYVTVKCQHCFLFFHTERGWFQKHNWFTWFAKEKV